MNKTNKYFVYTFVTYIYTIMKAPDYFSVQEKRAMNLFLSIALVAAEWNREENDINSAELQKSSIDIAVIADNSEHDLALFARQIIFK